MEQIFDEVRNFLKNLIPVLTATPTFSFSGLSGITIRSPSMCCCDAAKVDELVNMDTGRSMIGAGQPRSSFSGLVRMLSWLASMAEGLMMFFAVQVSPCITKVYIEILKSCNNVKYWGNKEFIVEQ